MTNPKSNLAAAAVDPVTDQIEAAAPPDGDLFSDLSKLRLSQDFIETAGVKKLLMTVPVRKPNPQDFSRVHPHPTYRMEFAVIDLKDDREMYLLTPPSPRHFPVNAYRLRSTPRLTGKASSTCGPCVYLPRMARSSSGIARWRLELNAR